MSDLNKRQLGIKINKLRRYKLISDLYLKHKTEDIPTTVIWRKYVYPIYPISRTTLYEVLSTPIERDLRITEELIKKLTK